MLANRKGSAFERKVAKMVAKTFHVRAKECYRTPLSGGHPYADKGDLVMGPKLRERFPFVVECKHRRNWTANELLKPKSGMLSWMEQVKRAANGIGPPYYPILVVRGNRTEIVCFVPELVTEILPRHWNLNHYSVVRDRQGVSWYGFLFTVFLKIACKRRKRI